MTKFEPKTGLRPAAFLDLMLSGKSPASTGETPSMTEALLRAVRRIDEDTLRRVARTDAGVAFQPRTLLAILSFCYARQIYSSCEIEELMKRDVQFRKLCGEEFPGAGTFRRFRRDNREALQTCLTTALKFLAHPRTQGAGMFIVSETDPSAEAERRISIAAFIDSLELED